MTHSYACHSPEHAIARRSFLNGMIAGGFGMAAGVGGWLQPSVAEQLKTGNKRVLTFFMNGGLSQLESWDPKPGTKTGGPFRAIPTSVPGLHICELLPHTAKVMHHLAVIRGLNTKENDHGKGRTLMVTGRRQSFAVSYPHLGAVVAHQLQREGDAIPGNIHVYRKGGGGRSRDAGFLGPQFASTAVSGGTMPNWSERSGGLTAELDAQRRALRSRIDARFAARRPSAATSAYSHSFEKALQLMEKRHVFDLSKESAKDHERYGKSEFASQCLLARRLLEHDVPFVGVRQDNYDTHNENFNFHLQHVGEFDKPFATLIRDLADRGLLEHTLVLVISEFGRTPRINSRIGRDHWSQAWSVVIGGTGIQRGAIIGKTNDEGTEVIDRQVDHRHMHHTILEAIGVGTHATFEVGGQSVPIADPSGSAIDELLA